MQKFIYDNFYAVQSLIGLTMIGFNAALAMIEVERMNRSSKALHDALYDCDLFLQDWQHEKNKKKIKLFAKQRFGR